MKKPVIFTDLDGTLLDHSTYSFRSASPALALIRQKDIPLVLCSSKTRREIEYYRRKLDNHHPFVSENGGGIFIPRNYFAPEVLIPERGTRAENDYLLIALGAPYSDLRKALEALRKEGFDVKGFGDMTASEITEIAGLTAAEAEMSKERDFDEPFIFEGGKEEIRRLSEAVRAKGYNFTQGRFFHILGESDKGKAVAILSRLYNRAMGDIMTIALGDSPNDLPMLEVVDCPVIVRKPDGSYDPRIDLPNLIRAEGIGPEGWNEAVRKLLTGI